MRVAVFGASGVQGAAQVRALARAGHEPVAISRAPKPTSVDGRQIETLAVDFTNPRDIQKAVASAETILLNLPSTSFSPAEPILAACRTLGEEAKRAGTRLIVFNTSMPVPEETKHVKAQDDRREMRRVLREAGVPLVSIQPVCYIDNLLEGWAYPHIRDAKTLVYCHKPSLRASWICHDDVAQLVMAAMTRPHLAGRNIPVGGPEAVRLPEVAGRLGRAWGVELGCVCQTVDDFCLHIAEAMGGRGLETDRIIKQMHKAYTWYNEAPEKPFVVDMDPVLEELPVKLTTIEDWGRAHYPPDWK
jgi:uncharacterized protein YbjT (DUF2867 family)